MYQHLYFGWLKIHVGVHTPLLFTNHFLPGYCGWLRSALKGEPNQRSISGLSHRNGLNRNGLKNIHAAVCCSISCRVYQIQMFETFENTTVSITILCSTAHVTGAISMAHMCCKNVKYIMILPFCCPPLVKNEPTWLTLFYVCVVIGFVD